MSYKHLGPTIDRGESHAFLTSQVHSEAKEKTGSTVSRHDPETAGQTSLETANKPDVNVDIGEYDPEVQALLAYE